MESASSWLDLCKTNNELLGDHDPQEQAFKFAIAHNTSKLFNSTL